MKALRLHAGTAPSHAPHSFSPSSLPSWLALSWRRPAPPPLGVPGTPRRKMFDPAFVFRSLAPGTELEREALSATRQRGVSWKLATALWAVGETLCHPHSPLRTSEATSPSTTHGTLAWRITACRPLLAQTTGILPAAQREPADAFAETAGKPPGKEKTRRNSCECILKVCVSHRGLAASHTGRTGSFRLDSKTTSRMGIPHSHWLTAPIGGKYETIRFPHSWTSNGRRLRRVHQPSSPTPDPRRRSLKTPLPGRKWAAALGGHVFTCQGGQVASYAAGFWPSPFSPPSLGSFSSFLPLSLWPPFAPQAHRL